MGRKEINKGPQQVMITWGNEKHQETMIYQSLFQVAAQLTQVCHPNGATPKEVVATFTEVYEPLIDWYKGSPMKVEIRKMLDVLLPDPPGYDPNERVA